MGKEIVNQVQEAQSLTQDKPRRKMLRHILIKLTYQTRRLKAQSIKHNIKSIKGRETSNIQWKAHTSNSRSFCKPAETLQAGR